MTAAKEKLYKMFSEVRTCFNLLKSLADQFHNDLGISPSMRAVMEVLAVKDAQTVPDIARRRGVSRQHIQSIMNALFDSDLVEFIENPAHKRSPLFSLTKKGEAVFKKISEREEEPLNVIAKTMSPDALDESGQLLAELNRQLEHHLEKGRSNYDK